jgi:hypothetical protein
VAKQIYRPEKRPPVLLIVLDTLRADHVTSALMPVLHQFMHGYRGTVRRTRRKQISFFISLPRYCLTLPRSAEKARLFTWRLLHH